MRDQTIARLGAVMCLPVMWATWQMGDHWATVLFAFCCGFFFNEQLSPTDGTSGPTTKGQEPHPSPEQKGSEQ